MGPGRVPVGRTPASPRPRWPPGSAGCPCRRRWRERVTELEHLARDVRADGYRRVAVLGMGGSSLAPELFARVFGWAGGRRAPGRLRPTGWSCASSTRPIRTWCAASVPGHRSSGRSSASARSPGRRRSRTPTRRRWREIAPALDFVAITDPGTALAELARAQEFRAIVTAPPDVGGRYSALTVFGLRARRLHGVDIGGLLARAQGMAEACRVADAAVNPGLALGARAGRGGAGGPRQAHVPDLAPAGGLRRLGRAAHRGEHRQGGHRDRPDRRRGADGRGGLRGRPLLRRC